MTAESCDMSKMSYKRIIFQSIGAASEKDLVSMNVGVNSRKCKDENIKNIQMHANTT